MLHPDFPLFLSCVLLESNASTNSYLKGLTCSFGIDCLQLLIDLEPEVDNQPPCLQGLSLIPLTLHAMLERRMVNETAAHESVTIGETNKACRARGVKDGVNSHSMLYRNINEYDNRSI